MRVKQKIGIPYSIGCSMLGEVLGVSSFGTPYDAYLKYTGQAPEPDEETKRRLDMGHDLEEFIARQAEKRYGVRVRKSNFAYKPDDFNDMVCHPDRMVAGEVFGERIAMEIKSNTAFDRRWGQEDTDEIPMDYLCQCLGYFICGVPCDAVWLVRFSNNTLYRYIIRPNEELQRTIKEKVIEFVAKVAEGWVPDPMTYKEATGIYSNPKEEEIEATPEIAKAIDKLSELKEERLAIEKEEDALKREVVSYMRDRSFLTCNGETIAKYTRISQMRFDAKALEREDPETYSKYLRESSYMKLQ